MTIQTKFFAIGAAVGDLALLALQAPNLPSPTEVIVSGGVSGSVSLFIYWVVKPSIDRHDAELRQLRDSKADAKDLDPLRESIARISHNIDRLVDKLLD